jgi:inosose dehydratase
MSALQRAGYQGWLVVEAEQDPAVAPSYRYARMGYQCLRSIVERLDRPAVS